MDEGEFGLVSSSANNVIAPGDVLAAMDSGADRYLADNVAANTKLSYEGDWKVWRQYCAQLGVPDTSNTRGALVGFVLWLQQKPSDGGTRTAQAPSTIDRRLAGVVVGLTRLGCEPSTEAKQAARAALTVYRKRLTESAERIGRGKAAAVKVGHLHRIAAACPDSLAGARDRALILVGFRIAARSAELANLLAADVEDVDDRGMVVTVRFGKTGGRRVPIPFARHEDVCPVRAWQAWRSAADHPAGLAFAQITKGDRIRSDADGTPLPLGPRGVRGVIDRAAQRAGIDLHLTGHSLRSGFATEARRAGYDRKTISTITGHTPTSAVLEGYFREVDEWTEAPDDIL